MSQVFLSYKRDKDDVRANIVREKLEALGVTLFVDVKIGQIGDTENYISVINRQLASAASVLVLWTEDSVKSDFVISEAERGFHRKVLVAASFGEAAQANLPVPFNTTQAPDLSGWIESGAPAKTQQWQNVLGMLGRRLQRPGLGELAIILETGDDQAKRVFVRDHPEDPFAVRFADELEAVERSAFKNALGEAQKRLKARFKKTEKKLIACREEFERNLADLRAGRDFMPPDPINAIDDNVEKLKEDIEIHESAAKELRERTEQAESATNEIRARLAEAEKSAEDSAREIAALNGQIKKLNTKRGEREATAGAVEKLKSQVDVLEGRLGQKEAALAEKASEIAALSDQLDKGKVDQDRRDLEIEDVKKEADQAKSALIEKELGIAVLEDAARKAQADSEENQRRVAELEAAHAEFAKQPPPKRNALALATAAAVALLLGLGSGWFASGRVNDNADRVAQLTREKDSLAATVTRLTNEKNDLTVQLGRVPNDKQAPALLAQIQQLTNDRNARDAQITTLRSEKAALADQAAKANAALADQIKRLDNANDRIKQLTDANAGLVREIGQLKDDGVRLADIQKREVFTRCDELSAYQHDLDRPPTSKWMDTHTNIAVEPALKACRDALVAAGTSREIQRRIILQTGRVYAAQGVQNAKMGNVAEARRSFKDAFDNWTKAADMGSGHANNVLGLYFEGEEFSVMDAPTGRFDPQTRNLARAWPYYQRSAELKNPIGLTTAAFWLLYPEKFEGVVAKDFKRAKDYLILASKFDYPRTYYALGRAIWDGNRGYDQSDEAGRLLIGVAYCKKDKIALSFYREFPAERRPKCD